MTAPATAEKNPLGYENISKLLSRFAIPSIIAMVVSALYNIVDQIFIGQDVGVIGNAATNVAFPLTTICVALALLLGVGGAANFNLHIGAGNHEKASKMAGNAIAALFICGIVILILVRIFLKPLLYVFGSTDEVYPYALIYTGITSIGMPFLIISNGLSNLIRADGSPTYSMALMLVGAIINTILDALFIFVFHWGIAGAAWATVIGQIASCLMAILYLRQFKTIRLIKDYFYIKKENILKICSLGAAGSFNQLAMLIVQIALNNSLTYYGELSPYGSKIPLACAGIITKTSMIFLSVIIGIAQGCQPIVSFNYGAKNYARVRKTYAIAVSIATAISIVGFICFQLFPLQIIRIFGDGEPEYFLFAERYFRIYLFMMFLNGIQPVTSNFFSSIGKAVKGIFLSMTRQILFLLPLILILPRFLGIDGIMYAGPVSDFIAAVLAAAFIYFEFKNMKKLEAKTQ